MRTWYADRPEPVPPRPGPGGWILALLRGAAVTVVLAAGLALLLLVRLIEAPMPGRRHPVSPFVTQIVCRISLWILGLRCDVQGTPQRSGALVANHSSWLDILVLNAAARVTFVSKSEVAGWPGIGWLARATGTLFIRRDRSEATLHTDLIKQRIEASQLLLLFPEGTSSDGRRILQFKTTLFEAFMPQHMNNSLAVQPVSVSYRAPVGRDSEFYGWWGDMALGPHLLSVLGQRGQGSVRVVFDAPLPTTDHNDRKQLAQVAEQRVRAGFQL